jgi:hypothetical protein
MQNPSSLLLLLLLLLLPEKKKKKKKDEEERERERRKRSVLPFFPFDFFFSVKKTENKEKEAARLGVPFHSSYCTRS